MKVRCNTGFLDRLIRLVIACGVIYLGLVTPGVIDNVVVNWLLVGFGVMNLYSAATGYCPVYDLANLSTLRKA